jgi:hypothetical protein
VGRRLLDRLDDAPPEAGAGLIEPDTESVAGNSPSNEDHIAVNAAHAFTPEREVVNGDGQALTTLGARHGSAMIRAAPGGVNLTPIYPYWYPCGEGGSPQV